MNRSNITMLNSFGEWKDMSVFLEMKPRTNLASLFIDVPPGFREKTPQPEGAEKKLKYEDIDVVNVNDNTIRLGAPPSARLLIQREKEGNTQQSKPVAIKKGRERSTSGGSSSCSPKSAPTTPTKKNKKKGQKEKNEPKPIRFGATLRFATMNAKTLCSPTWAENNPRLFMCKLEVEPDNLPLVPKTLHRLATDICKQEVLGNFAAKGSPILKCSTCNMQILSDEYIMTIGCLPDDDWLSTTQSIDFYCRDSCGAGCDPEKHNHGKRNNENKAAPEWLPSEKRVMISYANTVVHISSVLSEKVKIHEQMICCAGCKSQLGRIQKNHPDIYSFNHISTTLFNGPKKTPFIERRIVPMSIYMAQIILNSCESQSSSKLVIRSLDKVPYMLVWLLDSYVAIANGELEGLKTEEEDGAILTPFPAIKLLYKVFNNTSAVSDPRANGEDTSVGLVDIPLPCCQLLIEMLLRSSLRLPTVCRAVGQFFVGYIQIDENI